MPKEAKARKGKKAAAPEKKKKGERTLNSLTNDQLDLYKHKYCVVNVPLKPASSRSQRTQAWTLCIHVLRQ